MNSQYSNYFCRPPVIAAVLSISLFRGFGLGFGPIINYPTTSENAACYTSVTSYTWSETSLDIILNISNYFFCRPTDIEAVLSIFSVFRYVAVLGWDSDPSSHLLDQKWKHCIICYIHTWLLNLTSECHQPKIRVILRHYLKLIVLF